MFYAQVGGNGKVLAVCDSPNRMVETAAKDDRMLGTMYDLATDTFTGFKITLTASKAQIAADGIETATITATAYNWDDTIAVGFDQPIIIDYVGNVNPPESILPVNGVASIPFTSNEPGDTVFMTENAGNTIMSNGQITVKAVL